MNRKLFIVIIMFILILSVVLYYFKSNYVINYKVDNYKVKEQYKNNKYYFEISDKKTYNFDSLQGRKFNKKQIDSIKYIKDNEYVCIIPLSNKIDTYPLCFYNDSSISYSLVNSDIIKSFFIKNNYKLSKDESNDSKDFKFYNNLDKNEYIAIWKYNGFYILNENNIKTINLFKKDRYSNDLCFLNNKYLLLPNYNQSHEFTSFYKVDITSGKKEVIKTDYSISYESIIKGSFKNSVYFYDNKYKKSYVINIKKGSVYEGKLVHLIKDKSNYIYLNNNGLLKKYNENKNLSTIIYNKDVNIIDEYKDNLYFVDKEYLYKYKPILGYKRIVKNFEWNFNLKNTIFIYNE